MERELWSQLMTAIQDVARTRCCSNRFTYDTALVVRVYLWSVLHDRPVYWACQRRNWNAQSRPSRLPSQSTMSRRLGSMPVADFLKAMGRRLSGRVDRGLVKILDGKPLPISRHSGDGDSAFGRGAGGVDRGYKLHVIWGNAAMPQAWAVCPMNISEVRVAGELLPSLRGCGYVLGDGNYDRNALYDLAARRNHQLLACRSKPYTDLGHRRHSAHRLRAIELLEGPGDYGRDLYALRRQIETHFAALTSFGGGLTCLPPWVRRLRRVRLYVHGKLLINAARIRLLLQRQQGAA